VDLGNMMLVLALRSDAQTVYDHALRYFTPAELSEAFAATRGVASPTQLRQYLKEDGRELLEELRAMVPPRKPIAIQRWSLRRVALITVTALGVFLAILFGISLFFPTRGTVFTPSCGTGPEIQLMAQAVPTARQLPCVGTLPLGWGLSDANTVNDSAVVTLQLGSSEVAIVTITVTATCPPPDGDAETTITQVDGGCVEYRTTEPPGTPGVPTFEPGGGLAYVDRSDLVAFVDQQSGQILCGADAPAC
jgi:hypothetical protein